MIAIDLGHKNLKFIRFFSRKNNLKQGGYYISKQPKGLIEKGKLVDKEAIRKRIIEAMETLGHKSGAIRISLPRESGMVRAMDFPILRKGELRDAVKWEISRYLPFQEKEALIDFKINCKKEKKLKVTAAAISREVFFSWVRVFEGFKRMKIDRITLSPAALYSISRGKRENQVQIDWGAKGATFLLLSNGEPAMIRSLNLPEAGEPKNLIRREAHDAFTNLGDELERALLHIPQEEFSTKLKKIEISGGNSRTEGFQGYLEERFNTRVVFPDIKISPEDKENDLLTVAFGLGQLGGRPKWRNWIFPGMPKRGSNPEGF